MYLRLNARYSLQVDLCGLTEFSGNERVQEYRIINVQYRMKQATLI